MRFKQGAHKGRLYAMSIFAGATLVVALLRRKRNAVQTGRPQGAPLRDVDICRGDPCGRPPSAKEKCGSNRAPTRGASTRCRYLQGRPLWSPSFGEREMRFKQGAHKGRPYATSIFVG